MKELKISNSNKVAIVDDWEWGRLSKFKWVDNGNGFIYRQWWTNRLRPKHTSLAAEIMNQLKQRFDHKDRDGYNNLEENLRVTTCSQNGMNRTKSNDKSSIFKGVCWDKNRNKWGCYITVNGIRLCLGRFKFEIDAAITYNMAAMKYFGEFAALNPVPFTW